MEITRIFIIFARDNVLPDAAGETVGSLCPCLQPVRNIFFMTIHLRTNLIIIGASIAILGACAASAADFTGDSLKDFAEYDKLMLKRGKGQISEADSVAMNGYLKSALANYRSWRAETGDSVPVPAELAKTFGSHYNDFTVAGIFMFQDRDYRGAYDIWEACVDVPDAPEVAAALTNAQNSRGQIAFNRAMAATQAGMEAEALASYDKAYELGYADDQLFDSAIMQAEQARDYALARKWAARGVEKKGPASVYRDYQIKYATAADPAEGEALCTEAIAADPGNPRWYNLRVIAYEKMKNHEASLADLRKITELTPDDPVAFYNYGGKLMFMANYARNEKTAKKDELKKMYADAAAAFEQAVTKSNGDRRSMPAVVKSLNSLDQIYHTSGDKAGKKRVEQYRRTLGITK